MKTAKGSICRRQKRKEIRKEKKARKHMFFSNKKQSFNKPNSKQVVPENPSKRKAVKNNTSNLFEELNKERMKEKKSYDNFEKAIKKTRIEKWKKDNEFEDKEIRHLEKQLGLKKKSKSSLNKFFAADGLDYLLDVCEKKIPKTNEIDSLNDESGSLSSENSGSEDETFSDHDDVESDDDDSQVEEAITDEASSKKEVWEDLYGRLRDNKGNVINSYEPPQLKSDNSSENNKSLVQLKRQIKGLLNRLAENNMVNISSQMELLYMSHSRNEMNETLWRLLEESIVSEVCATPERLVAEHAMLVAILSANVGSEISAHCIQRCVTLWNNLFKKNPDVADKRINNTLQLMAYFHHFQLFHCTLVYDILEEKLSQINEKNVELILLVLKIVGFSLRKGDPIRLKTFILKVQQLANDKKISENDGTRINFLLDIVLAIKNNNMGKIPNYNPEYLEHLRKILKSYIRKGSYCAELKISLEDILKVDERGRWWVVGSAWTGLLPGEKRSGETDSASRKCKRSHDDNKADEGYSEHLLELAKKQRMNTDSRRSVFCLIMSAEDYVDAFEKLVKLGLKGAAERDIMNVLLHCLLQEKVYNPYYMHLARRFCTCDRRFQVQLQYAVWDRLQELNSMPVQHIRNLGNFLASLITERCLAISVLKVVQFAELEKSQLKLMRQVLLGILLSENEDAITAVFARIARPKELKVFREGLRLFLHHFLLRDTNDKTTSDDQRRFLPERIKLADAALSS